ncbi:MAG TPA: hypothetical protein VFZ89_01625 [Solirubrobacteraceae bacterium]
MPVATLAAVALATPSAPCEQPTLLCPNLVMRTPSHLHLLRTPKRRLLATANAIVNVGPGPLRVRATRIGSSRDLRARQIIRGVSPRRDIVLPPSGEVYFYDTRTRGRYWKFEDAAGFELWSLDAAGNPVRVRRRSPKIYYCFRDLFRVKRLDTGEPYTNSPRRRVYPACSTRGGITRVRLGTSVGWVDYYPWHYPQNYINVTGLRGCYLYVHRADPENRLREADESDNASARVVRLPWRGRGRRGCPAHTRIP